MSHIQLLRHAIEAARAGNPDVARQSLLKAAEIVPDDPVVWLWMSWLADSPLSMVQGLALAGRHESCREIAESGLRFARALARFDCHALERERSGWSSTEPVMPPDGFPAAGTGRALEYFPGEEIRSTDMAADTESNRLDAVSTIMDDPDLQADRNELHQTDPPALHGLGLLSRTADAVTHELLFDSNADQTGLFSGLMSAGTDRDSAGTSSRDALASEQKVMVEPAAGEGTSWYDCWLPRDHHPTAPADSENITLDQAAAGRNSQWQADAAGLPASEDFPRSLTAPRELQADPTAGWSSRQSETIEECSVDTQAVMPSKTHEGSPAKQSERMFSYRNPDRQGNTLRYVPPVARSAFQIPPGLTSDAGPALSSSSDHRISETDSDCDLTAAPARGWTPPQPVHDPVSFRQEDQSSGFDVDGRAAGIGIFNGPPGSPAALSSQPPLPDSHRIPGVTSGFLQSSGLGPAQGVRFPEVVNSPESLPQTPVDSDNPLPQKNSSSNRRTVLVAGNCQTVHKQIQMTLERYGLRVVYALDGPAAIQESARWNPSVILMDVSLPQLDGYQLCRLIRQQESMRQIPVVMLIDRDSLMSRLRGRMAGCSGCLAKPFTSEELVAVMERHVSESIEMIGTSG